LKRGLLGRKKNERRACGIFFEGCAHFGEAAESFAAAGGAEEKARLHGLFSRKGAKAQRIFIVNKCRYFLFPFGEGGLSFFLRRANLSLLINQT
jgi:hypothetical protein